MHDGRRLIFNGPINFYRNLGDTNAAIAAYEAAATTADPSFLRDEAMASAALCRGVGSVARCVDLPWLRVCDLHESR